MEALHWCLFGRTSRGVRAGNVKSWRAKGAAFVEVRLEKDATPRDVTRTWGPNSLKIDGVDSTQEQVEALVGLRENEFLHSVYCAQFAPSFLDLSPGEQLALYSQVMQLERWERASDRAAKAARDLDAAVRDHETELARGEGALAKVEEELPGLRRDAKEWVKMQRRLIEEKESELRKLKA